MIFNAIKCLEVLYYEGTVRENTLELQSLTVYKELCSSRLLTSNIKLAKMVPHLDRVTEDNVS